MEYLTHPIAILFYIVVALAVILPWLKKKAQQTETVVDDKIITYLGIVLSNIAKKIMGLGKFSVILVCLFMLSGCVFTGFGINYETGNYLAITAKDGGKNLNAIVSIKDADAGTLEQVAEKIAKMIKEWKND